MSQRTDVEPRYGLREKELCKTRVESRINRSGLLWTKAIIRPTAGLREAQQSTPSKLRHAGKARDTVSCVSLPKIDLAANGYVLCGT